VDKQNAAMGDTFCIYIFFIFMVFVVFSPASKPILSWLWRAKSLADLIRSHLILPAQAVC
jgi:hypothetical protein